MVYIPKLLIFYLMISALTQEFIFPSLIYIMVTNIRLINDFNLVRLILRIVNSLSLERYFLSLVLYRRIGYFLNMLWTELSIVCCSTIEFSLVSIINMRGCGWSLYSHLKRYIVFVILCFIIERRLLLSVFVFNRI